MATADAHALLDAIGATARPAGSAAETAARRLCADWLKEAGFEVVERPFTYSALPGVCGTPVIGLALFVTGAAVFGSIGRGGAIDPPLKWAVLALVAIGLAGWWLSRCGTRILPVMRRSGVNLEARGGVTGTVPTVWLVAHLDTKSQPVSLLMRAVATIAVCSSWAAVLAAWGVARVLPLPHGVLLTFAACATLAALPLAISQLGANSEGALDNASGVTSILSAARALSPATPLGVVVTSAEEFGLAGARAWVEGKPTGIAINCDGVDDQGTLTITAGAAGRDLLRITEAGVLFGQKVRFRRSLPGILLDSTAFSDRGWAAVTVSRGTLRSLARIHTRRDTLAELSGAGIDGAADLIAALSGAIIAGGSSSVYQRGGSESAWNHNV